MASAHRPRGVRSPSPADSLEVTLREPPGDRDAIDTESGETLRVVELDSDPDALAGLCEDLDLSVAEDEPGRDTVEDEVVGRDEVLAALRRDLAGYAFEDATGLDATDAAPGGRTRSRCSDRPAASASAPPDRPWSTSSSWPGVQGPRPSCSWSISSTSRQHPEPPSWTWHQLPSVTAATAAGS